MIGSPELGIPDSVGGCAGFTCPLYHAYRVVHESVLASGPSRECILLSVTLGVRNLEPRSGLTSLNKQQDDAGNVT